MTFLENYIDIMFETLSWSWSRKHSRTQIKQAFVDVYTLNLSYKIAGRKLNISGARLREILNRICRMLRHPSRNYLITMGDCKEIRQKFEALK